MFILVDNFSLKSLIYLNGTVDYRFRYGPPRVEIGPIGLGGSYGPLRNTSVAVKEQS